MTETPQEPESFQPQQNVPPPIEQPSGSEQPASPPAEPLVGKVRTFAILCHILGFAGFVFPFGGNIIAPLVMWLINKEEYPQIDQHGKESVNFQISITIYALVCIPLTFICVGFFLAVAVGIFDMVAIIIAAVKASNGQFYRYPLCLRFIK